jgi:2',3'-cyclic-nucleotide 2'-phosphodiesterase (5'-nucleotidase family)
MVEVSRGMKPMLGLEPYHVLEHQGFKIGFMGFAEKEWIDQFPSFIDVTDIKYIDYNESLIKYS